MPRPEPSHPARRDRLTGLVLAGGRASRMGGIDKGLVEIAGRPMIEHVLDALRPQVGRVLINANRNLGTYRRYGHPVISDAVGGYLGPLAGILAGLAALDTDYLLTVPCDSPLLAPDLAGRMFAAAVAADAEVTVAHDGARQQPVFLLLRRDLAGSLRAFLAAGERKIDRWFAGHRLAEASLADRAGSFVNVNDPAERERVEALLLQSRASPD